MDPVRVINKFWHALLKTTVFKLIQIYIITLIKVSYQSRKLFVYTFIILWAGPARPLAGFQHELGIFLTFTDTSPVVTIRIRFDVHTI